MKIIDIKKRDFPELTWDLEVEGVHNYILENNIISHNSSSVSNSTAGIEPPRELVTTKTDKNATIKKLVPFYKTSKNYYTTSWGDDFNNVDYFKLLGIIQPFVDQAISTNQYSNILRYKDKKLPINDAIKEILIANNSGLKSLYYQNFLSVDNEDGLSEEKEQGCSSGGCSV